MKEKMKKHVFPHYMFLHYVKNIAFNIILQLCNIIYMHALHM